MGSQRKRAKIEARNSKRVHKYACSQAPRRGPRGSILQPRRVTFADGAASLPSISLDQDQAQDASQCHSNNYDPSDPQSTPPSNNQTTASETTPILLPHLGPLLIPDHQFAICVSTILHSLPEAFPDLDLDTQGIDFDDDALRTLHVATEKFLVEKFAAANLIAAAAQRVTVNPEDLKVVQREHERAHECSKLVAPADASVNASEGVSGEKPMELVLR